MNTSPRELHRPTDDEFRSAMEIIRRDFAADYHRREVNAAHARGQIIQLEEHARGCLSRIPAYREMAAEYPVNHPKRAFWASEAARQWRLAKDAMRRVCIERMKL